MIFIAYNHDEKVISIVNARSIELALAFWQGKSITPHSHKCVEADFLHDHPTGIYPLLETAIVDVFSCRRDAKLLCIK